jgi:transcriptional regulator with XRE-family HTH domain
MEENTVEMEMLREKKKQGFVQKRIADARKKAGYTQQFMAEKMGISQPAYSYYENSNKNISTTKIQKIAGILGVPVGFFLSDTMEDVYSELKRLNCTLERIADLLAEKL